MTASKKMRELNRARIEHDKSRRMAAFAESKKEMVCLVDSALAGKVDELMQQLASRDAEVAELVAALGYFDGCKDEYLSASLDDTLRLVEKNDQLREQVKMLRDVLQFYMDNGICEPLYHKAKEALAATEPKE